MRVSFYNNTIGIGKYPIPKPAMKCLSSHPLHNCPLPALGSIFPNLMTCYGIAVARMPDMSRKAKVAGTAAFRELRDADGGMWRRGVNLS